jgi:hypothetical protein
VHFEATGSSGTPQRSLMDVQFARELIQRQQFRVVGALFEDKPQPTGNACRSGP